MLAQAMAGALERTYATRVSLGESASVGEDDPAAVVMLGESVQMSSGETVIAAPRPPVLVMGEKLTDELVFHCANVQAEGCVLMDDDGLDELIAALEAVQRGQWVYPHSMRRRMMEIIAGQNLEKPHVQCPLTAQEQRVLEFLVEDLTVPNKHIAKRLDISIYTVKNHMHNILEKLGVGSRQLARELAVKNRWFSHSKA